MAEKAEASASGTSEPAVHVEEPEHHARGDEQIATPEVAAEAPTEPDAPAAEAATSFATAEGIEATVNNAQTHASAANEHPGEPVEKLGSQAQAAETEAAATTTLTEEEPADKLEASHAQTPEAKSDRSHPEDAAATSVADDHDDVPSNKRAADTVASAPQDAQATSSDLTAAEGLEASMMETPALMGEGAATEASLNTGTLLEEPADASAVPEDVVPDRFNSEPESQKDGKSPMYAVKLEAKPDQQQFASPMQEKPESPRKLTPSMLQPAGGADRGHQVPPEEFLSTAAYPSAAAPSHPSSDSASLVALQDGPPTAATMAGIAASSMASAEAAVASTPSAHRVEPRHQAVASGSFMSGPWKQAPFSPAKRSPTDITKPLPMASSEGKSESREETKLPLLQGSKDVDTEATGRIGGTAPAGAVPMHRKTKGSGYQAVATEDGRYDRGSADSSHRPAVGSSGRLALNMPDLVPREACGQQRLSLRDQFNLDEISAVKLIQRYDTNKNGVLEPEELVLLLKDQNKGVAPKYSDVEWLMVIADKDQSQTVSSDEVLHLVKVWYAFKQMPSSVNSCITKYAPTDGPLMTVASFKAMLEDINDFIEVSREEAVYVRALAQALGATEKLATRWQLRQAISGWYLQVNREQTDGIRLAMHTVQESTDLLRSMSGRVVEATAPLPMDTTVPGSAGPAASTSGTAAPSGDDLARAQAVNTGARLILEGLHFLLGIILLDIAERSVQEPTCGRDLKGLLWWRGFVIACMAVFDIIYMVITMGKSTGATPDAEPDSPAVAVLSCGMLFLQSVFFVQGIFGIFAVLFTSADECGQWIWNWCAFVFVWLPLLFCLCSCCFVLGLAAFSLNSAHEIDRSFHE